MRQPGNASASMLDGFELSAQFAIDATAGIPGNVVTTLTIPSVAHPGLSDQPALDAYAGSLQLLELDYVYVADATVITRVLLVDIFDENGLRQWATRGGGLLAGALGSLSIVQGVAGFLFLGLDIRQSIPVEFYLRAGWSIRWTALNGVAGDRYFPRLTFLR